MWFILILLNTCVYGVQITDDTNTSISYCAALDEYYEEKTRSVIPLHGRLRSVFENSEAQEVEVWGGRGAARAAAALLYVIIRYGLRYNTKLVTKEANICEITVRRCSLKNTKISKCVTLKTEELCSVLLDPECTLSPDLIFWNQSAVVAPAAYWPRTGCDLRYRNIDHFTRLSRAAVKSDLQLFMYLAPKYRRSCKIFQNWTSFIDSNATEKCNLATLFIVGDLNARCDDCVAILASTEYDVKVVQNYENQIQGLQLKITYYESDLKLRQGMKSLREKKMSFLFIYDYILSDIDGTYELATYKRTHDSDEENTGISLLVGDGTLTYYYAPDIHKVLTSIAFTLDTNTLREILEIEDNEIKLEEAACFWANKSRGRFESLTKIDYDIKEYMIVLLVCDRELLYNTVNTPILKYINTNTSNIKFTLQICSIFKNCNNITQLQQCLKEILRTQSIPGVVLSNWSDKITPVVDAAAVNEIFLTFASPVPNKVNLKTCRSVAGNLFELAQAYHKFFAKSNWYRISVISEATESAHTFTEALKSSNNITWKDIVTDKEKINDTLSKIKNLDARIIVLNSEWSLSKEILCAAIELEMTSTKYVWITRDRDVLECDGQLVDYFKHISIGLEWRGGMMPNNFSLFSREEWISFDITNNKSQRTSEAEWDGFKLPLNVYSMIKAIIRLSQAFTNFRNDNFETIYNLHGKSHVSLIASYFDRTISVNGSTIFIDEWWGNRRRSIAVWQAENKNISDIWLLNNNIFDGFLKISDRTKCIIKSGDPFAPRCHDVVTLLLVIMIILLVMGLVIARRLRLARLAQKDLMLLNAVTNHRKQVASSLDAYIVERHLVRVLHEIGSGCFGRVHFAELTRAERNAVVVAAKEPHNGISLDEEREFLQEALILAQLSHDHIVRLIGVCTKDGPPMLLMEHALYLDLRRYLIERRHLALKVSCTTSNRTSFEDISDESLTRYVRQAAAALEYLASRRLVHRDVRAANCLIDKERSLKLGDFGMARRLNGSECEYASHRRALFPVLYMAPESLDEGLFSPATDVWALGVLMLEVVTLGARPFGSWPTTRVVRHVSLGGHAPLPPDASIHTRNLAMSCWKRNPEDRPSAAKIEKYLTMNPQALSAALLSPNPLTEN